MHCFEDANGRLNIMLLLNRFLLEESLSPVILKDPAVFGGALTLDELVNEVDAGIKRFAEEDQKARTSSDVPDTVTFITY